MVQKLNKKCLKQIQYYLLDEILNQLLSYVITMKQLSCAEEEYSEFETIQNYGKVYFLYNER